VGNKEVYFCIKKALMIEKIVTTIMDASIDALMYLPLNRR
jgi:hypothetical protein